LIISKLGRSRVDESGRMPDTRELTNHRLFPIRTGLKGEPPVAVETVEAVEAGVAIPAGGAPCVDIVVPVFNEVAVVEASVTRLHDYLSARFPFTWRITIVDNASTDGTWFRAARLARDSDRVRALHLDRKGRGLALRTAWNASDAAVVAYMDVDLSTDLDALLPLVAPLVSGHSDLAIGSRLSAGSSVARRPKRELISRSYNAILHAVFATAVSDAQCGFKAVRADVARRLLPVVEDDSWFFDTELLLLAEHNGLRIHEVPVDWIDDADTRVHVARTARDDLVGTLRLARSFLAGGGRVELGDAARGRLVDDFGRRIVSIGVVSVAGVSIALASFVLLSRAFGVRTGAVVSVGAGIAVATRRLAGARTGLRPGRLQ
jgi:glycosyltransferase involved in cell wall biosynthesis